MAPDEFYRTRKRLGLTQARLAKHLGVSRLTVIRWEGGQQPISRIAALLMKALDRQRKEAKRRT